jgi:Putative lumazine-binding
MRPPFIAIALLVSMSGISFAPIASATTPPASDESNVAQLAVQEAVERYFSAADSGNPDAVRATFWPTARVEGIVRGKLKSWTAHEFATQNFKGEPSGSTSDVKRTIEWIDVSGPGAVARVKVEIRPSQVYWDYFLMFQADGQWKIGVKAFANPQRG